MPEISSCVFWSCYLYLLYLIIDYFRGVHSRCCDTSLYSFCFGCLFFFIWSVKTGSRLLSVTQQQFRVCSVHWCVRRGARKAPVTKGQVHRKRREKYTRGRAAQRPGCITLFFNLWTGEKPVSINASQKSDDASLRSFSIHVLTQATTFLSRSLRQLHVVFPGFLLQKSQIMQDQSLCAFHLAYL